MYTKEYFRDSQYKTPSNLQSRMSIHERFSQNKTDIFRWIFDHYKIEPGDKILEIGAGTGEFWKKNVSRLPQDIDVVLTDLSEGMIETCKTNFSGSSFLVADAENLPFKNGHFDVVLAHFMLYHATSPVKAISEARRVLNSDGFFSAVTGSEVHLKEIFDLTSQLLVKRGIPTFPRMGAPFWEQNAEHQLKSAFRNVVCDSFSDELHITDVSAVIDYVRSQYPTKSELKQDFFEEYRDSVQNKIDQNGFWKVTKRTMLYICRD